MKNEETIGLLFELLDSSNEALDYVCEKINNNTTDSCVTVFEMLEELYENIADYIENNNIDEKHRGREAAINAALAAKALGDICTAGDCESASLRMVYELLPLNVFLRNELYFWFSIYPDIGKIHENRNILLDSVMEYVPQHNETLKMEYAYDVTIMLLCYNKAYLTRIAYESLLKYTDFDKYSVEIIVVNNGSTDNGETSEFIRSINDPRVKTVDLKYPLGYNAYSLGPIAAQGRYFVEFHSDIIATKNWLDNLVRCISSNSHIGAVVAACNESSNRQAIYVSYSDPLKDDSQMQQFANEYNHSNPLKWEYKIRIMPTSGYIIPTMLYRLILRDPWLYYGQFADDDMSTILRRSGFKQIVAKDTFLHHFGSQTSSSDIAANENLELSRKRYYEKWGIDAWYSMVLNITVLNYLLSKDIEDNKSFLFIDPLFCATPMYLFNELHKQGKKEGKTGAIINDLRYTEDARYYFDFILTKESTNSITDVIELCSQQQGQYNYIIFHQDISEYIDKEFPNLLKALHTVSKYNSKIIFTLKNAGYYENIKDLANGIISSKPYELWSGVRYIDHNYVIDKAKEQGFYCSSGYEVGPNVDEDTKLISQVQSLIKDDNIAKTMTHMTRLFVLSPKPGYADESDRFD